MKKIKIIMMAFAALSSVGTAYAVNHVSKLNGTTYYAVKLTNGNFIWQTSIPRDCRCLRCQATTLNSTCTIVTSTVPTDGVVPAGHSVTNQVYE